jgi:hypothetical protein
MVRRPNDCDEYDFEDPFIDDSEQIADMYTVRTKERGFFVYKGTVETEVLDEFKPTTRSTIKSLVPSKHHEPSRKSDLSLKVTGKNKEVSGKPLTKSSSKRHVEKARKEDGKCFL